MDDDDDSDGRASQAKKKYNMHTCQRHPAKEMGNNAGNHTKKRKENPRGGKKGCSRQANLHKSRDLTTHITQKEKRGTQKKTHRLSLRLNPPQLPTTATQRGHGIRNKTPIPNSGGKIKTTSSFQLLISPASNLATKTELCRWFP